MTKEAVVIYSGGLDSTVLIYHMLNLGYGVHALTFDYGQRHKREIQYAKRLCKQLDIPHKIIDVTSINTLLQGSSQTTQGIDVPEGHYAADNMKLTIVPNRNAIMLNLAIGYAVSMNIDIVAFAAHAGDHAIYPDCRPLFVDALQVSAKIANDNPNFQIYAPFINKTKSEIVTLGYVLNVPFEKTYSCYKGKKKSCGKCGTCVERKEAFKLAGVNDLMEYEN